jgi:hypothetical protein
VWEDEENEKEERAREPTQQCGRKTSGKRKKDDRPMPPWEEETSFLSLSPPLSVDPTSKSV